MHARRMKLVRVPVTCRKSLHIIIIANQLRCAVVVGCRDRGPRAEAGAHAPYSASLRLRLIFRLAAVPEQKRNTEGRQRHDGERNPVQDVRRELSVVVLKVNDSSLARRACVSKLPLRGRLGWQIADLGRREIEITGLLRLQNNDVRYIAAWSDALPLYAQTSVGHLKVSVGEALITKFCVQRRTSADVKDVILDSQVLVLN